jgi:predicted transcriptional regulator
LGAARTTARDDVIEMIRRLPADATLEDIAYHVTVMAGVDRGLRAIEDGKVVTQAEVERLMNEWPLP